MKHDLNKITILIHSAKPGKQSKLNNNTVKPGYPNLDRSGKNYFVKINIFESCIYIVKLGDACVCVSVCACVCVCVCVHLYQIESDLFLHNEL